MYDSFFAFFFAFLFGLDEKIEKKKEREREKERKRKDLPYYYDDDDVFLREIYDRECTRQRKSALMD